MLLKKSHLPAALALSLFFLACGKTCLAYTVVSGTIYVTDGSQADVNSALAAAPAGDTIQIPPGTFTWGTNGAATYINSAVNLLGSGTSNTTIILDPGFSTGYNEVINITAGATVGNFSLEPPANTEGGISAGPATGWRVTNINYNNVGNSSVGYFCYAGSYGLIDNCTVAANNGECELIFGRGPNDSWQTGSSMGKADNVIVEDSTFNGTGYVCDANSNARFVIRFCTITGPMKVDGHGLASNTPARGVRQMEIYDNTWTSTNSYWAIMELRGGTGVCFNNASVGSNLIFFFLNEYGATAPWANFGNVCQTPYNYPIADQIGEGPDLYVGGTSQGTFQPPGYVQNSGGSAPYYIWNVTQCGQPVAAVGSQIPANAIAQYQSEVGGTTATFTMVGPPSPDIIEEGRDYFQQGGFNGNAPFTGADGVGVGTTTQMNGIKPTKIGVGFWVTDQGTWNNNTPGSGMLYTWQIDPVTKLPTWEPTYTPYQYPDPQAGTAIVTGSTGTTGTGSTGGGSTGSTGTGSSGGGSTGTGSTGGTGTSGGGWVSTNGVWTFSPYAPAAPATVPPAPTNLQVTGT